MRILALLLSLTLSFGSQAQIKGTLLLNGQEKIQDLAPYMQLHTCEEGSTLQDAQKNQQWQNIPKWPKIDMRKDVWYKLSIENQSQDSLYYFNVWGKEQVFVYVINGEKISKTSAGASLPRNQRTLRNDPWFAPVQLPRGELSEIYIKAQRVSVWSTFNISPTYHNLSIELYSYHSFIRTTHERLQSRNDGRVMHYVTLGGLILFFLFGIALYTKLRDRTYLNYSVYLSFVIFYGLFSNANGSDALNIADHFPLVRDYKDGILFWFGFLAWLRFANGLLNLEQDIGKAYELLHRFSLLVIAIAMVIFSYLIITHDYIFWKYSEMVIHGIAIIAGFIQFYWIFFKSKSRWTPYFKWAISVLLFIAVGAYLKFNFIGSPNFPYILNIFFTMQTGAFIDTCIFTFAIASKIKFDNNESLRIQDELMIAERTAVQAQLNPHFIFNSLNAVQNLVIKSNKKATLKYISEFASLLRSTLQNSTRSSVSLAEELENLDKYIRIEAIRMDERFAYSFEIDQNIETGAIQVPNLLLQPFAENAIWHGLMHSTKENLLLTVEVAQNANDEIEISITDNGVGRNSKSKVKKNPSLGINLIQQRMAIFNQNNRHQIELEIIDQPNSEGTKVMFTISFH